MLLDLQALDGKHALMLHSKIGFRHIRLYEKPNKKRPKWGVFFN